MTDLSHPDQHKALIWWLAICCFLVATMVLLGGAVRLTGSGLSMVDWRPLMGAIPPLSEAHWQQVFEQYQQYPEYQIKNQAMSLEGFKFIFIMEYAHRLLGRGIGIVFFVPFVYFLIKRRIPGPLSRHLWALFLLGAIQGVIGWYMVKSGLVDIPQVSQYRLALHLLMAVLIFIYMIRVIVGLSADTDLSNSNVPFAGTLALALVLIMIFSGALVAGTHAGFIFNTFPKMGANWIPDQLVSMSPMWRNLFENPITIQFVHRCLALIVMAVVLNYGIQVLRDKEHRSSWIGAGIICTLFLQLALGISTLMLKVPVPLGVAHQGGALLLIGSITVAVSRHLPKLRETRG